MKTILRKSEARKIREQKEKEVLLQKRLVKEFLVFQNSSLNIESFIILDHDEMNDEIELEVVEVLYTKDCKVILNYKTKLSELYDNSSNLFFISSRDKNKVTTKNADCFIQSNLKMSTINLVA